MCMYLGYITIGRVCKGYFRPFVTVFPLLLYSVVFNTKPFPSALLPSDREALQEATITGWILDQRTMSSMSTSSGRLVWTHFPHRRLTITDRPLL